MPTAKGELCRRLCHRSRQRSPTPMAIITSLANVSTSKPYYAKRDTPRAAIDVGYVDVLSPYTDG